MATEPPSVDVLAAQVRGAIDSQAWLVNNVHNSDKDSWGSFYEASREDAERGRAALVVLVGYAKRAEELEGVLVELRGGYDDFYTSGDNSRLLNGEALLRGLQPPLRRA